MLDFLRDRIVKDTAGGYPLSVMDYRTLPEGYVGPVFIWDIDKTYLNTRFSSLRGLGRIPLEFAVDKRAIQGMPEILRGLRRGPGPEVICAPLYFISASPPFLREAIEKRMLLDGVEYDGTTFKDWFLAIKALRPERLLDQVGFKMCALLRGRMSRPLATEYLFGDDVEQDARAFTLYSMLLEGTLSAGQMVAHLTDAGVSREDRRHVMDLYSRLPDRRGSVDRIFIHLARNTAPAGFEEFGKRVVPVRSAFQLGLALYELSLVDRDAVHQACSALIRAPGARRNALKDQIEDARARGLVTAGSLGELELYDLK